ncbi:ribosomal protein S18 acetylase RimI-like enzyme [Methylorubrum rhodinum]|uniref:Ribosomal protein S18 acetylase RimI-like enzyme n=1 Tax=Methylorubrum rhodinum TaxID=29428 RepID=A0A840ZSE0_9HYPH|nr:GNAT family N-acetyltransferase [Methylorubrum rhodinum]MBB5760044.1 ribosomal protein S18 acetylase RimI-like enzyme [Methylorubrum rhodinum]
MSAREEEALAWTVEEACLNAWPLPCQRLVGGYLLRASGGPSRRPNSVNPLRGHRAEPEAVIAACEAAYAGLGRPALFRVPEIAPDLDASLERRGYTAFGRSLTLLADLADHAWPPDPEVTLAPSPDADWLAARAALNAADSETSRVYAEMIRTILLPKAFAAIRRDGAVAAMAYAALDRDLVVIESVGTLEALRGQGLARRVVAALLRWGRAEGARAACLQVVADNAPARRLYAGLGFARELFSYSYRSRDPA